MPTATVYIRKEDAPAWQAIKDKSGWVRTKLHETEQDRQALLNTAAQLKQDSMRQLPTVMKPISKPPEMSTMRWLQHLKDNGIDLADTSVDTNPDWGA